MSLKLKYFFFKNLSFKFELNWFTTTDLYNLMDYTNTKRKNLMDNNFEFSYCKVSNNESRFYFDFILIF